MNDFEARLATTATATETVLHQLLPGTANNLIAQPMRHAALGGGKRLRAFLVLQSAALFNVDQAQALRAAAAIECMHAYSLVHDDLPCMDDDAMRRGKPTLHVKWDEATAVLAGDALQSLAFEILSDPQTSPSPDITIKLVLTLARAAGAHGMVLGQMLDIAAQSAKVPLDLAQITELQAHKTGALIEWSAQAGAVLADEDTAELRKYAHAIGLAYQIQDDILDVLGDAKRAGKRLQKDADAGKATFVSLLGLEQSRVRARALVEQACAALARFGAQAEPLRQAAQFVIGRDM